ELKSKTRTEYLNDSKSLTGYSQVLRQTEYDADGNIVKETSYVIGHQRISQTIEVNGTKTTHYFTFDGHGSTRVLLDAAMTIAQIFAFDAYGNAIGFIPATALTDFLYSGEQFDSKIGQQYLRARYYDPATGRFNRLDPFFGNLNDPQSLHNYLYAHSDSINNYDPTGNMSLGAAIGIGMAVGAGLGLMGGFTFGAVNAVTGMWTGQMDLETAMKTWGYYSIRGIVFGASFGGVIGASVACWPIGAFTAISALISFAGILSGPDGIDKSTDNFLAELPYFSSPSAVVYIMSNKIKEEAKKHDLPPELISAVLMFEMYQYHIGDALFDDEVISGAPHSIGIAQLRINNVRDWCPSNIHLTDAEIRNKLYTWNGSIEFLAEAMAYWRDNSPSVHPAAKPTIATWKNSDQQTKEKAAALYSTCKDDNFKLVLHGINDLGCEGEHRAGILYGKYGLRQTQFLMDWFGLFK
ncbi:MAG: RHS repeat-associated core domain-containing protein, partial [Bacteroidales bacterium]|nr:RHS repeat-associated core domain-containing protein [Bacteroidales bacterium]